MGGMFYFNYYFNQDTLMGRVECHKYEQDVRKRA